MMTNLFILLLMLLYLVEVQGDTLLGSSLNSLKTLQLNEST